MRNLFLLALLLLQLAPHSAAAQNSRFGDTGKLFQQATPNMKAEWRSERDPLPVDSTRKIINFGSVAARAQISKEELSCLFIVKGNVYFTGAGFPQVLSMIVMGGNLVGLPSYHRVVPGTRVVFEPAIFWNADGTKTQSVKKAFIIKPSSTI